MATHENVRPDDNSIMEFVGDWCVAKVGNKYRVYEDGSEYTAVSGMTVVKGKMVRRWDPDAGDQEGKPAAFDTVEEAVAYIKRWLEV